MNTNINDLMQLLKVEFHQPDTLRQALVHRSYLNEHPGFVLDHNERLEFLGDAVLELVVTEHLYVTYPNPEGELTNWRASLVNADRLAGVAKDMGLEEFLYLSKGEQKDAGSKARRYILANAIEAVIGAMYLDQGWEVTRQFIHTHVLSLLPAILERREHIDPKSRLQERAQEFANITPSYKVLSEEGPDHAKTFVVGVFLEKEQIGEGTGSSKQEAQVQAAAQALQNKGW